MKIVSPTESNPSRILWKITTQWSEHTLANISSAYTDIADDYKIIRWESNDNVVPEDIMNGLAWPHKQAMDSARSAQTHAVLGQYMESQANRSAEEIAEEAYEMLSAFGKGETVINVITGTRRKL